VDVLLAKLIVNTERKRKYERAAANPLNSVARDRPLPQTEEEAADWLRLGDYRRALAVYDELARTYPDLVEAHSRSAWLRATCPDAQYRDGKVAVESARRACELTDWQNPGELEVLAAACAEAGDLGSAVKWQEKVLTLTVEPAGVQSCQQRLALYRAGKPFREP
jgi:tetratricopeptide (TPR) repeat protein